MYGNSEMARRAERLSCGVGYEENCIKMMWPSESNEHVRTMQEDRFTKSVYQVCRAGKGHIFLVEVVGDGSG